MLTAKMICDRLSYDPVSGIFRWKSGGPGRAAGSIAGCLSPDGYWRLKLDYRKYSAGRIAWLMMTGAWPSHQIDHINGNRSDNRWTNLREATQSQNNANRRVTASKFIPIKGIYYKDGSWEATIQKNGQSQYLGRFRNIETASAAYKHAAVTLFGEFAKC